jgi:hypothetical protein
MNTYAEGSTPIIPIAFVDNLNQPVIPTAASYRIDDILSGGDDMTLDNTNIAAGQQITITGFTLTEGN